MKITVFTFTILIVFPLMICAQWVDDPMVNTAIADLTGEQAIPKIATTDDGTTYISWFSNTSGNYNVMLQKLDVYGNKLWPPSGLTVSDHPAMTWLTDWDMTVDQEGCAILTFQDIRNTDNDAFAYRISPVGVFLWGDDGVELSTGPAFDAAPKVCVTNAGNAVFAWQADEVVIMQKISPEGDKLWGENGLTLSGANTYSWPQLMAVGEDDVLMKYFEDSGPVWAPTRHVFVQRYDSDGNGVWASPAVVSDAGGISAWTQIFPFINDGNDGFYMAWHDDRDANNLASVFVQHIDAEGNAVFTDNGVEASTMPGRNHFYPQLALIPGADEIIVVWNEMDGDQINRGLYGQKLSADGSRLWGDNGKTFIELSLTDVYPVAAEPSDEDFTLFYEYYFDASSAAIRAMRIDADGDFVWENDMVEMCSVQSSKVHTVAGHYNSGQWIAAWEDNRNGNSDIYGQNIQLDGSLGPVSAGSVKITPDTLVYEENPQTLQVHIVNNSSDPYTITYVDESGDFWYVYPMPVLPYTVDPGDSLLLDVTFTFITADQTDGYYYSQLEIDTETDTTTIIIAINEDLLIGMNEPAATGRLWRIYPNPSKGDVYFEVDGLRIRFECVITDIHGEEVFSSTNASGNHFHWNGRDHSGNSLPSGIYFYHIISEDHQSSGKIILME